MHTDGNRAISTALIKAITKRIEQKPLTDVETRAIKAWDRAESARYVALWVRAVPLGEFKILAGLSRTASDRLATRYRLPLSGQSVDLGELLTSLFSALESNESFDLESGGDSPALERYRNAKADLAELELAQKRGELLPLSGVREGMGVISSIYKNGIEAMERSLGPAAGEQFSRLIDEAIAEIDRFFPEPTTEQTKR